ncbi:MAG: metallopeptidase family protein [Candidatus Adlerbacteria bacterium]|nr:metallopeptidase family protein [Candidatus Adlerbacteria bacterium]MDZ4225967.1 metallopeptidase family protein [Patescibacteria group bacterium]
MTHEEFEQLVAEESGAAVPEKFRGKINNVAFLVEQEPSAEIRKLENLKQNETLLGYYRGVPHTVRGEGYGVGGVMPDTITLYQGPIEEEAAELGCGEQAVRKVIRDTIWHEVAHHFGMDEYTVRFHEKKRNKGL